MGYLLQLPSFIAFLVVPVFDPSAAASVGEKCCLSLFRGVLHEAPFFELPHVVHGPMLATGLDSPLTSIATVRPSATASPMAVFAVCASWARLQVINGAMRCPLFLKVSPCNTLQATEDVNS